MSKVDDEVKDIFLAHLFLCNPGTFADRVEEVKSALVVLIKAEMGQREDEPCLAYNHGLYIQIQLDREAMDRAMGINGGKQDGKTSY